MSKKFTSKQQKAQLNNLFSVYNRRLGKLYADYIKQFTQLGYGEDVLKSDALFNFDNFPQFKKRLDDIFNDYFQNSLLCYKNGIIDGVALAYTHDNMAIGSYSILSDKSLETARKTTAATFVANRLKSAIGLNLAQTVWNYCSQTKSEFEVAMSNVIADGMKKGTSAEAIGHSLRKYLNNPDMMYRRYHTIKVLANGRKKDVVTWRRKRIIDGKAKFVEEPLEKVGAGVYRSSRKNALRVARTEINAAYHKSRNERWLKEPFVIGQFIHTSPQHDPEKDKDICDELQGRYPKDFNWSGWHPQCMCTSDPILIDGEEKKLYYDKLYAGKDMSGYVSPNRIKDVPKQFAQYIRENSDSIVSACKRDKLAWHLADNKKYWTGLLTAVQRKRIGLPVVSRNDTIQEIARARHAKRDAIKIQHNWTLRRSTMCLEKMNEVISNLTYTDYWTMGNALQKRYADVLEALKSDKTWSVANVERLFKRFKQGASIRQRWDKQLWDGFSRAQVYYCRRLEKKLGILKGRPMTWKQADQQNANPRFIPNVKNGYQNNCATCSPTYMMRLLGFNVTAGNYSNPLVEYLSKGVQTWEKWLNADGTQAAWVRLPEWMNTRGYKSMTTLRYKEFINEICKDEGVYEMSIGWGEGQGHSTIIQRFADGKLKRVDAQVYCDRYYGIDEEINLLLLCQEGEDTPHVCRGIMRIDDKVFNTKFAKIFQVVK